MNGIKGFLLFITKIFKHIWNGSFKKKADERTLILNQCINETCPCDELKKERQNIKKYKRNFEKELWQKNEQKYRNGEASESVLKNSAIGDIDLAIIEWFRERWLEKPSTEKIQFYLWLESVYIYHLKKQSKNKTEHFGTLRKYSHSKSILKSDESISRSIINTATYIIGIILYLLYFSKLQNLFIDLLVYISKHLNWEIQAETRKTISLIIMLGIFILHYLLHIYILYKEQYYREMIPGENKREAWIRHVTAIQAYQKVILQYLQDMGDFPYYLCPQDKEQYLKSQIINAWEQNALLFQKNMNKESEVK